MELLKTWVKCYLCQIIHVIFNILLLSIVILDASDNEIPQSLSIACGTTFGSEVVYQTETLDERFTTKVANQTALDDIRTDLDTKVTINEVTTAISGLINQAPSSLDTQDIRFRHDNAKRMILASNRN
jgi:hypothetical protein